MRFAINVAPGLSYVTNITGGSVFSDFALQNAVTFPQTISAPTDYYVADSPASTVYTISCKWQGVELLGMSRPVSAFVSGSVKVATFAPEPTLDQMGGALTAAYVPTLLYQSPNPYTWKTSNQTKVRIIGDNTATPACGTFVATRTSHVLNVTVGAYGQGGATFPVTVMVGVTANPPATPLFAPLSFPIGPAAGVTEFRNLPAIGFSLEFDNSAGGQVIVGSGASGDPALVPGRTYTWQAVTVAVSGAQQDVLSADVSAGTLALSPNQNFLFATQFGANTVQPIRLGGRPGWRQGAAVGSANVPALDSLALLSQFPSIVGTAVATGTGPGACAVSPDGTKLAVCNFTSQTVSFYTINTTTGALTLIGTSAVLSAGHGCTAVDWLSDSTAVLVGVNNGGLFAVTAVASPVVTTFTALGTNVRGIKRVATGTNNFWVCSIGAGAAQCNMATDTTLTVGTTISLGAATVISMGQTCIDANNNLYVAVSTGIYDQAVVQIAWGATVITGAHVLKPGAALILPAINGDGSELWVEASDNTLGAFETSDWGQTQAWLTSTGMQPQGAVGPTFRTHIVSTDLYVYVAMDSTGAGGAHWVWEWPGGIFNIDTSIIPTRQRVAVTLQ